MSLLARRVDDGPRLRLPSFARSLMDNRRRGFHPLSVELLYADDLKPAFERAADEKAVFTRLGATATPYDLAWMRAVGEPMLALRPREYAPGTFNFACVTGVGVTVIDGDGAANDWECDSAGDRVVRWGLFYDLIAELSMFAASVYVRGAFFAHGESVAAYAQACRLDGEWPRWWSDELQARHERRQQHIIAAQREFIVGAGERV